MGKPEIISFNKASLDRKKFQEPVNQNFIKPIGGLWGSTFDEDTGSAWKEWCESEEFSCSDGAVIFTLKEDAKIYEIDSYSDLQKLMEEFKQEEKRNSIFGFITCIDFEKMTKKYDAIHLTDNGQWATRYTRPYNLYGWDVESYLILRFDAIAEWRTYNAS